MGSPILKSDVSIMVAAFVPLLFSVPALSLFSVPLLAALLSAREGSTVSSSSLTERPSGSEGISADPTAGW